MGLEVLGDLGFISAGHVCALEKWEGYTVRLVASSAIPLYSQIGNLQNV